DLVRWRQGRCLPYGDPIAFWPLAEIMKAQAGIFDTDGPAGAAEKLRMALGALVGEAPEAEWMFSRLAPLAGASDHPVDADRSESFTAWRRFLEALAGEYPLVVVF